MPKFDEDHCAVCHRRITGHMWDPFCCEPCQVSHEAQAREDADRVNLDKYLPREVIGL